MHRYHIECDVVEHWRAGRARLRASYILDDPLGRVVALSVVDAHILGTAAGMLDNHDPQSFTHDFRGQPNRRGKFPCDAGLQLEDRKIKLFVGMEPPVAMRRGGADRQFTSGGIELIVELASRRVEEIAIGDDMVARHDQIMRYQETGPDPARPRRWPHVDPHDRA